MTVSDLSRFLCYFLCWNNFFFCILMNFYFVMHYIFLHTDLWTCRKNTKKENETYTIHRMQTHTQLHTDKKERKKHTQYLFLYLHEKKLMKINNKWSKWRKDRMLIRHIFGPFQNVFTCFAKYLDRLIVLHHSGESWVLTTLLFSLLDSPFDGF